MSATDERGWCVPCRPRIVMTSASSPLRIDWLPLEGRRIGLTFAPGKRAVSVHSDVVWRRSLAADVGRLARAKVARLVCLLEPSELVTLGISDLEFEARRRQIEMVHFPIRDLGTPAIGRPLRELVDDIASRSQSSAVVIHCAGGLGRTGVIAGLVLRELGYSADGALAMLEATRGPRCPETPAQRKLIASWRCLRAPLASRRRTARSTARVRGA